MYVYVCVCVYVCMAGVGDWGRSMNPREKAGLAAGASGWRGRCRGGWRGAFATRVPRGERWM